MFKLSQLLSDHLKHGIDTVGLRGMKHFHTSKVFKIFDNKPILILGIISVGSLLRTLSYS